jgi:hypothetical protein
MPVYEIPLPKDRRDSLKLHISAAFGTATFFHDEERIRKNIITGRAEVTGAQSGHTYELRLRNSPGRVYPRLYIDGEQMRYTKPAPKYHDALLTAAFVALFPGVFLGGLLGFGIAAMAYVATRWMLTEDTSSGFAGLLAAVIVVTTYLSVLGIGVVRILSTPVP